MDMGKIKYQLMKINHLSGFCRLILMAVPGICLLSCHSLREEIPEPDYNPFVLEPDSYIESKGRVVDMSNMLAPDTLVLNGKWMSAKKVKSNEPETISVPALIIRHREATPSKVDMTQFERPVYVPAKGVIKIVRFPKGVKTELRIESSGDHYLGLLSVRNGLASDWVECLMEDQLGRLWIGSADGGISVWDGASLTTLTVKEGLPEGTVSDLFEDSNGNIWIAFYGGGLLQWTGEQFIAFDHTSGLSDTNVNCVMEDSSGNIWIGTSNGLNVYDGHQFLHYFQQQGLNNNHVTDLTEDRQGRIWIGTSGGGVNILDGNEFSQITTEQGLTNNFVTNILVAKEGTIWIGTGQGLNRWDFHGLSDVRPKPDDKFNLGPNWPELRISIEAMMEDAEGNIWLGLPSGALLFNGNEFINISGSSIGLKFTVVRSLLQDSGNRIWLGTPRGGLYCITSIESKHFESDETAGWLSGYRDIHEDPKGNIWMLSKHLNQINDHDPNRSNSFDIGYAQSLYNDSYGKLLVASNALKIFDPEQFGNDRLQYLYYGFEHLPYPNVSGMVSLLEDRDRNIWLGGKMHDGLFYWDRSNDGSHKNVTFLRYRKEQGLDASWIYSLTEDQLGRIWIGSMEGVTVWDGNTFTRFTAEEGLTDNVVSAMAVDSDGHIWIATKTGGINIWDGKGFTRYIEQRGSPTNVIGGFFFNSGDIWARTNAGVRRFRKDKNGVLHYQSLNIYQGVDRSRMSGGLLDSKKRLWACSQSNLDMIDLKSQDQDTLRPKLSIFEVQPFFDQFDWRQVQRSLANGEHVETGDLRVSLAHVKYDSVYRFTNLPGNPRYSYNINHLTFVWSGNYWADPTSLRYSYVLEGKDQSWSPLVKENNVTFTDLRSGSYTLKVRAVAGNARWSDTASYSFSVNPPIWATAGAYTLYGLCALGLVLGLRHYERKRFVLRQKANSLEEIDKVKTEFFTNISHELRTPLTLILGPLKAIQEGTFKGDKSSMMSMMSQNGRRLLQLVNQLLDLSKLDQGKLQLHAENYEINELVQSVVSNFDSAASIKNIDLEFSPVDTSMLIALDQEKIKQVLFNLVGNAIKFTPEGGSIKVSLAAIDRWDGHPDHTEGAVKITVWDSGIGIPKEELSNIFNRFYQVSSTAEKESGGTGIGLALAQKLVHLHHGTIEVESKVGWGTVFTVVLPVVKTPESSPSLSKPQQATDASYVPETVSGAMDQSDGSNGANLALLLIVEDNAQMRQYIMSCLGDSYHYLQASNGQEGLRLADNKLPDLILSDVMMPEMDGYEFCRKVRGQDTTNHIPFIFLTAKADQPSLIKGLKIGSNDYVTKPFDDEVLRLKVRNHLDKMDHYRSFFSKQLAIKGDIETVESLDDAFLNRAIQEVKRYMDNHEFTVSDFAREIGMSQTQLYRKLMALTGQSPSAFIRSIRLKKAAQLIVQDYGNTSEVAYAVGFNNLSYFAKCFKEQFGVAPSSYGKTSVQN